MRITIDVIAAGLKKILQKPQTKQANKKNKAPTSKTAGYDFCAYCFGKGKSKR